jgi:hypothetical protein
VLRLGAALRRRRLSLSLRETPTSEEIGVWLRSTLKSVPVDRQLTAIEREHFQELEEHIAVFAKDKRLAKVFEPLAGEMPALNKAGVLTQPEQTVRSSFAVDALCLPPEYVLERPCLALDALIPPLLEPTAAMVEAALHRTPWISRALIPRLALLERSAGAEHAWGIEGVQCIAVDDEFHSPNALAFKGNRGNYWGKWRREISTTGLSRKDQDLYRRAGVLSAEPVSHTSLEFFHWINTHPLMLEDHIPQILRHIAHERGTRTWWVVNGDVPCIPVERSGSIRLATYTEAITRSGACFIDDFAELGEAIRRDGVPISLTVQRHVQVTTPITEVLRSAGIRSLRESASEPSGVMGSNRHAAPDWAIAFLEQFRSSKIARELEKRLDALGVESRWINPRWQHRLDSVIRVVVAESIVATYHIGRQRITATVGRAFDVSTGTLWIAESTDSSGIEDAYFDGLAERIFLPDAPPYCALTLERALRVHLRETQQKIAIVEEQYDSGDDDAELRENEPGEAPNAHYDWTPDESKNIPSPRGLSTNARTARASAPDLWKQSGTRPSAPDEDVQKQELKAEQYAWHCQIGLARSEPSRLSPRGSYVEHQENRKRLIEAHHPDAVDAGGARHAGNMLILSHLEHHRYGQRISRAQITDALRAGGSQRVIKFGAGKNRTTLRGVVIEILLVATGEVVHIFFTDEHRKYWLERAD